MQLACSLHSKQTKNAARPFFVHECVLLFNCATNKALEHSVLFSLHTRVFLEETKMHNAWDIAQQRNQKKTRISAPLLNSAEDPIKENKNNKWTNEEKKTTQISKWMAVPFVRFAWMRKINFVNDVCLLFNQYDYACNCDCFASANMNATQTSKPPGIMSIRVFNCAYLLAFFGKMLFIQLRLAIKPIIHIYVTRTVRIMVSENFICFECSKLKFICKKFGVNVELVAKYNGSHEFWFLCEIQVCFFFGSYPLTLIKLPILSREFFSMFTTVFSLQYIHANGFNGNLYEFIF